LSRIADERPVSLVKLVYMLRVKLGFSLEEIKQMSVKQAQAWLNEWVKDRKESIEDGKRMMANWKDKAFPVVDIGRFSNG